MGFLNSLINAVKSVFSGGSKSSPAPSRPAPSPSPAPFRPTPAPSPARITQPVSKPASKPVTQTVSRPTSSVLTTRSTPTPSRPSSGGSSQPSGGSSNRGGSSPQGPGGPQIQEEEDKGYVTPTPTPFPTVQPMGNQQNQGMPTWIAPKLQDISTAPTPQTPEQFQATLPDWAVKQASVVQQQPKPEAETPIKAQQGRVMGSSIGTETRFAKDTPSWVKDEVSKASKKHGVSPEILSALLKQESQFKPDAVSEAGAKGIAQFMPATAKEYGIDPMNPSEAIDGAARYLRKSLDRYGGDYQKAVASYNAGMGTVDKYGGVPPYAETENYVKNIMDMAASSVPEGVSTRQPSGQEVPEKYQEFMQYNPQLEGKVSGGYNIGVDYKVPRGTPLTAPEGTWRVIETFNRAPQTGSPNDFTNRGYGNSVMMSNEKTGERVRLSHLDEVNVRQGDVVTGGTNIAKSGHTGHSTGPHVDAELYDKQGKLADIDKTNYSRGIWANNWGGGQSLAQVTGEMRPEATAQTAPSFSLRTEQHKQLASALSNPEAVKQISSQQQENVQALAKFSADQGVKPTDVLNDSKMYYKYLSYLRWFRQTQINRTAMVKPSVNRV